MLKVQYCGRPGNLYEWIMNFFKQPYTAEMKSLQLNALVLFYTVTNNRIPVYHRVIADVAGMQLYADALKLQSSNI